MINLKRMITRPTAKPPPRYQVAKRRLQLLVAGVLIGVIIPLYALFHRVYTQLRQESLYQYRLSAETAVGRIDDEIARLIAREENRPVAHYGFFSVEEQELLQTKGVTLSPLSKLPVSTDLPGLIGYFQIHPDGQLSSPVLPDITEAQFDAYNIQFGKAEYAKRLALRNRLEVVLKANRLLHPSSPAEADAASSTMNRSQAAPKLETMQEEGKSVAKAELDGSKVRLRSNFQGAKLDDLNLDKRLYQEQEIQRSETESRADSVMSRKAEPRFRQQRKEKIELPKSQSIEVYRDFVGRQQPETQSQLLSFEGEIDPLQLYILQDLTLVLVRKVWRDQQRLIQGFLVDGRAFIQAVIQSRFHASRIGSTSRLVLSYRSDLLEQIPPAPVSYGASLSRQRRQPDGQNKAAATLIYQTRLVSPFDDVSVHIAMTTLPLGPGAAVVHVLAVIIPLILVGGGWGIYRLASRQMQLAAAQQNFVSAVSHELKTPLTSIRMYGEMLRAGWVPDEAKRQTYYDFIFFESERLSRLVANVLQLANLTQQDAQLDLTYHNPTALLEVVHSKVHAQVEAAGFTLEVVNHLPSVGDHGWWIKAEEDAVARIMINLVDNAIKFSAQAANKTVRLELTAGDGVQPPVIFSVRDYGPGVERQEQAKIFQLFYRVGSELTRTTPGTGIGLALVRELARKMRADIHFQNRQPGAQFQIRFQAIQAAACPDATTGEVD